MALSFWELCLWWRGCSHETGSKSLKQMTSVCNYIDVCEFYRSEEHEYLTLPRNYREVDQELETI